MSMDLTTTKYMIRAKIIADGMVEKPDVVGAIFGQTEGLIGDDLDLRELQKTSRIGRIEVNLQFKSKKSEGEITVPSSLDQVETAILASALETIDRVGPCKAKIETQSVEDVRATKKTRIIERAKELLSKIMEESKSAGVDLTDSVRQAVQVEEIVSFGQDKCPAGPNVESTDAIIVVEGRSDVLNLLKYGIKNSIAVEGTSIPQTIVDLAAKKNVTVFVDGDRGGELIIKEILQVAEVDHIARAPRNVEVEEMSQKQIIKALRNKIPTDQFLEMFNISIPQKSDNDNKSGSGSSSGSRSDRVGNGKPQNQNNNSGGSPKIDSGKPPAKTLSSDQEAYKNTLNTLNGSLKANLLNGSYEVVKEVNVRNLTDDLKDTPKGVTAVVFDGVITQRLVDLASEKGIKAIVGMKKGNVTKQPKNIDIIIKADLD